MFAKNILKDDQISGSQEPTVLPPQIFSLSLFCRWVMFKVVISELNRHIVSYTDFMYH